MLKIIVLFIIALPFFSEGLMNRRLFLRKGYPWIKKAECGKCENICHDDKHDTGGFTCIGISYKNNRAFYKEYIRLTHAHFDSAYYTNKLIFIPYGLFNAHSKKLPPYMFAQYYWTYYAKTYEACPFKVLMHLTDMSILSGTRSAIKNIQRISGLKVDGLWGKKTEKACKSKDFNIKKYVKERKIFLSKLKQCKRYCRGWNIRVDRLYKAFN